MVSGLLRLDADSLALRWLQRLGVLVVAVVLWYVLIHGVLHFSIGVLPQSSAWLRDLSAHLLLALILCGLAAGRRRYLPVALLLFSAFTLANALKLAILGGPVMPDDLIAARNLFLLLEGWQWWASLALVTIPLAGLLWMFAWRRSTAWLTAAALLVAVLALQHKPEPVRQWLDARFGDWVWNQRGNYLMRGLPLHLLQESARNLARRSTPPAPAEVAAALAQVTGSASGAEWAEDEAHESSFSLVSHAETGVFSAEDALALRAPRNVHMIVLESFWDPTALKAAGLSADPFDPQFRALWQATGNARALSPVFGGYTANAEFEVLCGFPVLHDNVFFEGRLRRDVPCLPRHLAQAGYRSLASHPNAAPFWNRINAYQRIGFDQYWSERDFVLDDMNREFLSDASLYRQVLARIEPALAVGEPLFNYVLTYFGHLDYPLNEARPARITARSDNPLVAAYANTVYYKTRELMAFLAELRARDPQALIVIFGDHLPALGWNHGAYVESGLLAAGRSEFTDQMFHTLVATPLILIDGERGPVRSGDLPMYALPAKILDLLGDQRPSMLRLLAPAVDAPQLRPLPGLHFSLNGEQIEVCRPETASPACASSRAWVEAVGVLERDLFSGAQHALRERGAS